MEDQDYAELFDEFFLHAAGAPTPRRFSSQRRTMKPGYCPDCDCETISLDGTEYCTECCSYIQSSCMSARKTYKPVYHLTKLLNVYTGKNIIKIYPGVKARLKKILRNKRFDMELLKLCKSALKDLKLRNRNVQIINCYNLVNKPLLSLTPEQRAQVVRRFNSMLSRWSTVKGKYGRKNLIKYSWILSQLLKSIGMKEEEHDFIFPLQRRSKLYQSIWSDISINFPIM